MIDYSQLLSRTGAVLRPSAIRQMSNLMAQSRDLISFAPGYPAEDLFPWEAFGEIAASLLTGTDGAALQYGATRGYRPLREDVLGLMRDRGIASVDERVVITTGSQQGLDLVARVLIDPGDVILVERPSYVGAISAFNAVNASMVGIRQDADGLDLDHLDRTVKDLRAEGRKVKFLYTVPNFQNPSGLLLALDRRRRVLEWAASASVLVLEDDPYRDLYFPDRTEESETRPIAADDEGRHVVYLSSFSKTLAPGFRVGWINAPEPLAARLELAKQAEDLCSGALDQRIVHQACARGVLAAQLPRLRTAYQAKRDAMSAALRQRCAATCTWQDPRGGFFLWVELAAPLTATTLLEFAHKRGVLFVIGDAFFVDGGGKSCLRLSFSAPSIARIEEGVARLALAIDDARAAANV